MDPLQAFARDGFTLNGCISITLGCLITDGTEELLYILFQLHKKGKAILSQQRMYWNLDVLSSSLLSRNATRFCLIMFSWARYNRVSP